MTITLPDDGPAAGAAFAPAAAGDVADFGERLVQPLAPVRHAAGLAATDAALAGAARDLDGFVRALAAREADVEAWPGRFADETKRLRDAYAGRLADGPDRDRFDAGFDLFAKAKAVETRRLGTQRRIADNRAALDRLLDGYAEIAAGASDPVTGDFAVEAGEAAIRHQAEARVITEADAADIASRYRADVAARRAESLVRDDPRAAAVELGRGKGGPFSDLPKERRAVLRAMAERRAAAAADTEADAAARTGAEAPLSDLARAAAFEAAFTDALAAGSATPLDIDDGLANGVIDEAAAARLRAALDADREARLAASELARSVAGRLARGEALDPGDPADLAAAEAWTSAVLDGEQADDPIVLRHVGRRLGFVPPSLAGRLELYWRSGEPRLMSVAADADPDADAERVAFRALVAAGLSAEAAAGRIREMREAGLFGAAG